MFAYLRKTCIVFCLAVMVLATGSGFWNASPAFANSPDLMQRLQMLRSTSPDSGIFDANAKSFNASVADSMIGDLQSLAESCAMAMEGTDPELRTKSVEWHAKVDSTLQELQTMRNRLDKERLAALKSVSPESGIVP
jgi:hypothetical protein